MMGSDRKRGALAPGSRTRSNPSSPGIARSEITAVDHVRLDRGQGVGGGDRLLHLRVFTLQDGTHEPSRALFIIHDQDPQARQPRLHGTRAIGAYPSARALELVGEGGVPEREAHGECGTLANALARRLNRAAVQLDEVAHDGEPEAEAAVRCASSCCRPGGTDRRRAAETPA